MDLRWTPEAAADLERIADHLLEKTPDRAPGLVRAIYKGTILVFPRRGRPGEADGSRELVLSPLPSLVVYRVTANFIHIVRILHGAQEWP